MSQVYDQLKNQIVREASKGDNLIGQPRYALIESYNPDTNMVICSFLPELTDAGEKILTNWLQIRTPMLGNGWGIVSPIELGDLVILLPTYQSTAEFIVVGGMFNNKDLVAKGPNDIGAADTVTQIGEYLLRSKTGFTMKFVDPNTLMLKGNYHKEEMVHIVTMGTDVSITTSDFVNVQCKTATINASDSVTVKAGNQITMTAPQITLNGEVQINGDLTVSKEVSDHGSSMSEIRDLYDVHIHDDSPPPTPQMPD